MELEKFVKFMADIDRYKITNYNQLVLLARDNNKAIMCLQGIIPFVTQETWHVYEPSVIEFINTIQKTKGKIEHLELFVS